MLAPKTDALSISLMKPKILETNVPILLVKNDLISICYFIKKSFKQYFYLYFARIILSLADIHISKNVIIFIKIMRIYLGTI